MTKEIAIKDPARACVTKEIAIEDTAASITARLEALLPATPAVVATAIAAAKALESRLGLVTSAVDAEMLATEAGRMRDLRKECEVQKKAWSTPLTRMVRTWGERLNPAIELCSRVERAAKAAVLAFQRAQESKVQEALGAAVTSEDVAAVVHAATARPMGVTRRWTFCVIHPAQLPDRFRTIDQSALDCEAREHKDATRIPGGVAICTEHARLRQ